MVNFASALYLGLTHPSHSLRPWARFTTGAPAALSKVPEAEQVASRLAALQGCETATLAPSTLHLFWDLLGLGAREPLAIYLDSGAYAIARWGVERAKALGAQVHTVPHYDLEALRWSLAHTLKSHQRPLIVADGICPDTGQPAPVGAYLRCLRGYGGQVLLDDTQSLGILGARPGIDAPYGRGGGGILRWHSIQSRQVILIASLAKGFGVPMASLSGSNSFISRFAAESDTRVYCSPPSVAAIHAAWHALEVNQEHGEVLRQRLARVVRYFRQRLARAGFSVCGGLFPVQTLAPGPTTDAAQIHEHLRRQGINTVLRQGRTPRNPLLTFVLTAQHRPAELDRTVAALARAVNAKGSQVSGLEAYHEHSFG